MNVTVKYEETVVRTNTMDIDDDEFLDWLSGWDPSARHVDTNDALAKLGLAQFEASLKEYLESGNDDWASDGSLVARVSPYDQRIIEVTL